jgi:hypothetical protein
MRELRWYEKRFIADCGGRERERQTDRHSGSRRGRGRGKGRMGATLTETSGGRRYGMMRESD